MQAGEISFSGVPLWEEHWGRGKKLACLSTLLCPLTWGGPKRPPAERCERARGANRV